MPLPTTGDFTSPQMAQRIVDEALVLAEGFRDAFTQAISEIIESAELIQLLQDIQAGEFIGLTPGVLDIIDAVEIDADEMLRIQREALAQAADITNQETGLDFRFDIINPRAAQAALNIGSYLVRYINESVRDRLREIIAEQTSGLLSVADARRMIRDRVGLLPQHAVAVDNYEAGLLASGMDPTRVQTLAARYSERLLRYRGEMISRTEVARATSVGQQEYWLQARDAGRLPPNTMRIWIVNIDELTCDICRPMQDSDPIGLEDYWTTVDGDTVYYPTQSHPNCRCTTGLVFPDLMNKVDPTGYERWLMTRPVQKHANHEQKSHGNWARQGQLPGIDWDGFKISDIERLKRSIGLRPGQEIWQHPAMAGAYWPRGEVPDDEWEAQYQVIEHVEGEWAKFGPARQIRDAAEKLLGLEEPERGDPTLDPYQESGLDPDWGGGEARVSDEEARVMALWFLEQSGQVEGKFYRGTEASVERMGLSEGDEFDVGLLSFAGYPQTAARFGTETIFVVENPIGYQGERLEMDVRYTDADADEFYNVVRTHAEKDELLDMYGEYIYVVGEAVSESDHPDLYYGAFDNRSEGLDTEFLLTGSYRIASIERGSPPGDEPSPEDYYVTDKGEVWGVVDVVTLEPIDRDGDGIILEGTDEERFVGKAEKSRRPAWLRLFELSLGEMALASGAVKKHAEHDQQSHGNWARTGSATPKEMREEFDGRLPMLDGYRNNSGLASATEYGTGSASFYFGSLPTVDSYSGRLILGKNSTAQQEWEDGYLDDGRILVDGIGGGLRNAGWWTNMGAWHQRMLSAAILGLEVPEAISYELVSEWSPLTAELVITGELTGETLDAHMDYDFGEGNWTDAWRNKEATAAEWFVADQLQRAWKALAAADQNPPIDYKLYRVVQNLNPDSELMNLKPGDTYHAPLGSYSAYTGMANDFLNRGADDERPEVVITVKPGARGAIYDGIGRGEFSGGGLPDEIGGPLEAVIAGKFQVTEVRVATDGTRHIEVAQVEYPDVETRYEEKLTFFTASDTQSEQSRQEIKNSLPRDADGDGIIFEGTPRERFTPLVAPVEKAEGRPRVPAWFFDDFAPAERHSDDALSKHANHDQKDHGNWAKGRKKQAARRVLVGAAALKEIASAPNSRSLEQFYADEYGWESDKPFDYVEIYGQGFSPTLPAVKYENFEGTEEEWQEWRRKRFQELDLPYSRSPLAEGGEHFTGLQTDYKQTSETEQKDAHEAIMGLTRSGGGFDFIEFTENYESRLRVTLGGFRGYTLGDLNAALWNGWRQSPYEDSSFPANRVRAAMHVAAAQLFDGERNMESWLKGVQEYDDGNPGDPYAVDAYRASELVIAPDEQQQKGVQAARGWWEHNYAETQKKFADAGVTHVALARGYTKRFEGDTVTPRETAAVSSWTASPEMAAQFAGGFGVFDVPGFVGTPPWMNTRGTVAYDLVPVEDIALVMGGAESEVIVINRPGKSYPSMTFPEGTQSPEAGEIISSRLQGMIDRDNDGIVGEGTDQERFVGKHANHDQKSHGNWARGGPYAAQLASVSESDLSPRNLRTNASNYLRREWVEYSGQALGRTMAAAMMGLPNYASMGDAEIEERYGEGAMDALHRGEPPQRLLEDMERGSVTSPQQVALMMKDAVESDPTPRMSYRGMVVTDRSPILNLIEGDTFKLPPSSFSPSAEVIEEFQLGGMYEPTEMMAAIDDAAVFSSTWVNVRFDLVPGAKVSASGNKLPFHLSPDPYKPFVPYEVIANGEFEVLRKEVQLEGPRGPEYTITIRQTSTFDPFENEYVDVEPVLADWEQEG